MVEDEVQGRVVWQNENLDDLVHAALRRQPDLHACRGGRRPRHGRDPCHPRRRPPDQRRAPDADLPGDGLDGPQHVAHPADPRRPTAPSCRSAMVRSASMPTGRWAICRWRCATTSLRLGWSHGDQEIFSTQEMIDLFDLGSIGRSAGALRFRQAREPERALHAPVRRPRPDRGAEGDPPGDRAAARAGPDAVARAGSAFPGGDAGAEGARQDAHRAARQRLLSLCRPPAAARRQGGGACWTTPAASACPDWRTTLCTRVQRLVRRGSRGCRCAALRRRMG